MSYHLYDIDELFTNADGTIQFIELSMPSGGGNGENAWSGHYLVSTNGSVTKSFPTSNLPSSSTANTHVLLATAGFQALTGITPDFVIPNGFLFKNGGTISWGSTQVNVLHGSGWVDQVAYSGLPTDGHTSLNIDIDAGHTQSTDENSPTNFHRDSGHVAANTAPEVNAPLLDKVAGAGQAFSYRFAAATFTDGDGDALKYTAKLASGDPLPDWLHFARATRTFSGTPAAGDTGTVKIKVVASDGNGGKVADTFELKVIAGRVVEGASGADTLAGAGKGDALFGLGGGDTIDGKLGNDTIDGGAGADALHGGGGADKFVFSHASNDAILDFAGGVDRIQLDDAVFTRLSLGRIQASHVQTGLDAEVTATSGDAGDFIKYETDTGRLYYDANGSGAGGLKLIATVASDGPAFDPTNDVFAI